MQGAQLPAKLDRARQAIAECYDLSELLTWKDQAAAICAAAKAAKMPELAKGANRVCKEALLQLGVLLKRYNSCAPIIPGKGSCGKGERNTVVEKHGLDKYTANIAVRFAATPEKVRESILADDRISASANRIKRQLARANPKVRVQASDAYIRVSGSNTGKGLTPALFGLRAVDLADVRALAPDEKKMVRAKVTEAMELLDAIEEALK